jgi:hypothetical protein
VDGLDQARRALPQLFVELGQVPGDDHDAADAGCGEERHRFLDDRTLAELQEPLGASRPR